MYLLKLVTLCFSLIIIITLLLQHLTFLQIKSLHEYHDLVFVKKCKLNSIGCKDTVALFNITNMSYNLRFFRELKESTCKTDYVLYSPVYRLRTEWNLSITKAELLDTLSISLFKVRVKAIVSKFE